MTSQRAWVTFYREPSSERGQHVRLEADVLMRLIVDDDQEWPVPEGAHSFHVTFHQA